MKNLKSFLTISLIAFMMIGTIDASAKSRRSNGKTRTIKKVHRKVASRDRSAQEVINMFSATFDELSSSFSFVIDDNLFLESIKFKGKCTEIMLVFEDSYLDDALTGGYLRDLCDSINGKLSVLFINTIGVPIDKFARSGISFKCTIKDKKGEVKCVSTMTTSQIVKYYNEVGGVTDTDIYDLEYFNSVVEDANSRTPIDTGGGIILKNITMEGTDIFNDFVVSNDKFIRMCNLYPNLLNSLFRQMTCKVFYDLFCEDELDAMIELGITFNVRLFIDGISTPQLLVSLSAQDVKDKGKS